MGVPLPPNYPHKTMKSYRPYNLESTGALIESAHPSPTRMDVLCSRQRGCKCVFFFPFSDSAQFRPIQSDSIRNRPWIGPIQTEISVKKKKKKKTLRSISNSLWLLFSPSPLSLSLSLSLSLWLVSLHTHPMSFEHPTLPSTLYYGERRCRLS